jgi:uncharacterized membrane protein YphA (DoxX/SURF4 family)
MFEHTPKTEERDRLTDWVLRSGVALVFVLFGMEKFNSRPDASWVKFFSAVGFGQWFRYVTGIVEVVGGLLVLIPRIARAGLALLAITMAAAAMIVTFRLGRPADAIVSALFFLVLSGFWWARRDPR